MQNQAQYVAAGLEESGEEYLQVLTNYPATNRITLVSADGAVLYDNKADESAMENHKDRQEIELALAQGEGEDTRLSATMGQETYYYAIKLADNTVLRMANTCLLYTSPAFRRGVFLVDYNVLSSFFGISL